MSKSRPMLSVPVRVTHPLDNSNGLFSCLQRVRPVQPTAQRLDQHCSADRRELARGEHKILEPNAVLFRRVHTVLPLTVECVKATRAGPLCDLDDRQEVLPEFAASIWPGDDPAFSARHVTGEEVQSREGNLIVFNGLEEIL